MASASLAAGAAWDHRYRSAGPRCAKAAACNKQRTALTAWVRQKPAFSTPERDASATSVSALAIAVWGRSHPRIGDQRKEKSSPGALARPWGSNTTTSPRPARASKVTARLSGRVEVVTTAPGASKTVGITTL
jgi:hypothetical protein